MGRFRIHPYQLIPTTEEPPVSHISVQQLKELRQRTAAGMLDCRQALERTGGDLEQAVEHLRRQAAADAANAPSA